MTKQPLRVAYIALAMIALTASARAIEYNYDGATFKCRNPSI